MLERIGRSVCWSLFAWSSVVMFGCAAQRGGGHLLPTVERATPMPSTEPSAKWQWYDASQLDIEGKGWTDTKGPFDRLPARAESKVRGPVWNLSRSSAGLCVRFVTDSPTIVARWTLTSANLEMPHMPSTGMSGLDLYIYFDGRWRWLANGRPAAATNESILASNLPTGLHEYLLYLPLYNGTKSLAIGIDPQMGLFKPAPRSAKPVCVYGTSIDQGGCASRPGMAHVAILGRRLDRPTMNFGFSGNGQMEPELADLLAELDPAVYVLDALHNMSDQMVAERIEPCVLKLRAAHPDTPILLVEASPYQSGEVIPDRQAGLDKKNAILLATYRRMVSQGVRGLYYLTDDHLLGDDGEATVDGVHATDLGFQRMADAWEPVLRQILRGH